MSSPKDYAPVLKKVIGGAILGVLAFAAWTYLWPVGRDGALESHRRIDAAGSNGPVSVEPDIDMHDYSHPKVLVVGREAAGFGAALEKLDFGIPARFRYATLPRFYDILEGGTTAEGGRSQSQKKKYTKSNFQAALEYAMPLVHRQILEEKPLLLLFHSKGASLAYELARRRIWWGHVVLSSPILNPSEALAEDDYAGFGEGLKGNARVDIMLGREEEVVIMDTGLREVAAEKGWKVHWFEGDHWWFARDAAATRMRGVFRGVLKRNALIMAPDGPEERKFYSEAADEL